MPRVLTVYQEQMAFGVKLGGGEFFGHGVWLCVGDLKAGRKDDW